MITQQPIYCVQCKKSYAQINRSTLREPYCSACFIKAFETEIHNIIVSYNLFEFGDHVAIGVSGGKDSTVLAHVLKTLNDEYNYGLNLFLLAIDEGISGYRDDSLKIVLKNEQQYQLPLTILSYQDLYGWSMDDVVKIIGKKNNCTYCGVFRRQALDRGAQLLKADKISTGHNADDTCETFLMNLFRGDINRFSRCSSITTKGYQDSKLIRCKPLMFCHEKEIIMYAHFKQLDYFSTECKYSPDAYRSYARDFIKHIAALNPQFISSILVSMAQLHSTSNIILSEQQNCKRCGFISSSTLCKACLLLESLDYGDSRLATVNASRRAKLLSQKKKPQKRPIMIEYSNELV